LWTKEERACAYCGKTFFSEQWARSKGYGRFCSHSCARLSLPVADPDERFWALVDKRGPNDCWPWRGTGSAHGYGLFTPVSCLPAVRAHRHAYRLAKGPIPRGLYVLHQCDNPQCVNPAHLSVGTALDNMRDKVDRGRQPRGSGHGRAKLSDDDVRVIRHAYASRRVSQTALAKQYGVSQPVISSLIRRETWAHLV
jgi:hypothetical protein